MESIRFTLNSNLEIWEFIDKDANHILVHNFQANNILEWWESTVKISLETTLENIIVRNMHFDLQTNISGLRKILEHESNFLDIYQFDKPISNTLQIESLPKNNAETILRQNGLKHIIRVDFESITVESTNSNFLKSIMENPLFANRMQNITRST